jgi:hypothetical protein
MTSNASIDQTLLMTFPSSVNDLTLASGFQPPPQSFERSLGFGRSPDRRLAAILHGDRRNSSAKRWRPSCSSPARRVEPHIRRDHLDATFPRRLPTKFAADGFGPKQSITVTLRTRVSPDPSSLEVKFKCLPSSRLSWISSPHSEPLYPSDPSDPEHPEHQQPP